MAERGFALALVMSMAAAAGCVEQPPPRASAPAARQDSPPSAPARSASDSPPPAQSAASEPASEASPPIDFAPRLAAVRSDPAPPATTRGRHYFTSNERNPELFRDAVSNLGGIVVGVGAEQMYLLGGWAKATALVLTDFDDFIVDLHEVYGTLFMKHDNIEAFMNAWQYRSQGEVKAALEARFPEHAQRWRKTRSFGEAGAEVRKRLTVLRSRFLKAGIKSFLTDDEEYGHLRKLWLDGRVRAVRGDLTQDRTLADVGKLGRETSTPIRVLYLSNAEDYFSFSTRHYRANVLALPFDDKSVVLRTRPHHGSEYDYVVQSGVGFQSWLRAGEVPTMCELVRFADRQGDSELYRLERAPGSSRVRDYLCD
ncbi:MAG: hypothetical protein R3B13_11270 [Polyangiaceae bacterium]